jgi:hypothetical protein
VTKSVTHHARSCHNCGTPASCRGLGGHLHTFDPAEKPPIFENDRSSTANSVKTRNV